MWFVFSLGVSYFLVFFWLSGRQHNCARINCTPGLAAHQTFFRKWVFVSCFKETTPGHHLWWVLGLKNWCQILFATVDQLLSHLCPGLVDDGIQPSHLTPKVFSWLACVNFCDDMNTGNPHPDVWENTKTPWFKLGKFQKKQHRFDSVPNGGYSAAKSRLGDFFGFEEAEASTGTCINPTFPTSC